MKNPLIHTLILSLAVAAMPMSGHAQHGFVPAPEGAEKSPPARQDARARTLLDEAKARLLSLQSLVADFESTRGASTKNFDRQSEIILERPARFRIESVRGAVVEDRELIAVSDGVTVSTIQDAQFAAFERPVRAENFFFGQNFLVQFFFDPQGIRFDPTDPLWGRSVSLFDTNVSAYDRDTQLLYLGARTLEGQRYEVVEIKYNTARTDVRQQIYVGADRLIYQVDTYFDGMIFSQKFRNLRPNATLPAATWKRVVPPKMPLIVTDPVRLGAEAPSFTLPGHDGSEITLEGLLAGKKGLFVCVLDGEAGRRSSNADVHLAQMRLVEEMKKKFEAQGLAIVCIVGGTGITPDLKDEMMLNWMPDVSRFSFPIAIDVDLEKGIQGSAFHNFRLNGRNTLLLDAQARVVFASNGVTDRVNQLALYQAMAQIGFAVSPADLESAAR